MKHGYTNQTDRLSVGVAKSYRGPEAHERARAEHLALTGLRGHLPVPAVLDWQADGTMLTEYVLGDHGQDLIDGGYGREVLAACGTLLRRLHHLSPVLLGSSQARGPA